MILRASVWCVVAIVMTGRRCKRRLLIRDPGRVCIVRIRYVNDIESGSRERRGRWTLAAPLFTMQTFLAPLQTLCLCPTFDTPYNKVGIHSLIIQVQGHEYIETR